MLGPERTSRRRPQLSFLLHFLYEIANKLWRNGEFGHLGALTVPKMSQAIQKRRKLFPNFMFFVELHTIPSQKSGVFVQKAPRANRRTSEQAGGRERRAAAEERGRVGGRERRAAAEKRGRERRARQRERVGEQAREQAEQARRRERVGVPTGAQGGQPHKAAREGGRQLPPAAPLSTVPLSPSRARPQWCSGTRARPPRQPHGHLERTHCRR